MGQSDVLNDSRYQTEYQGSGIEALRDSRTAARGHLARGQAGRAAAILSVAWYPRSQVSRWNAQRMATRLGDARVFLVHPNERHATRTS